MTSKRKRSVGEESLALHRALGGKIEIAGKASLKVQRELSLLYTPGVGAVSSAVAAHPEKLKEYTIKRNSVAVISDGSAVLGLGNIGPAGAIPVLEGKSLIFKRFAGVDAFPIALATQDTEEIVRTIRAIAPVFGGINLEDISAPRCFEIEARLSKELGIPVMHDDQHGTAIVVLAALTNALKITKRSLRATRVVINGAGPAGVATMKLLHAAGARRMIMLDSAGVISRARTDLLPYKKALLRFLDTTNKARTLSDALTGADVFIGVSRAGLLHADDVAKMAARPIVCALANPVPEIMPDEAFRGGAYVVATGRSDFPNQINNALVFPGVFRGALDRGVTEITEQMKLRAAHALARLVRSPKPTEIIPSIFDERVVPAVARAIRTATL